MNIVFLDSLVTKERERPKFPEKRDDFMERGILSLSP